MHPSPSDQQSHETKGRKKKPKVNSSRFRKIKTNILIVEKITLIMSPKGSPFMFHKVLFFKYK